MTECYLVLPQLGMCYQNFSLSVHVHSDCKSIEVLIWKLQYVFVVSESKNMEFANNEDQLHLIIDAHGTSKQQLNISVRRQERDIWAISQI